MKKTLFAAAFVALFISVATAADPPPAPLSVVVVLDGSGSMDESMTGGVKMVVAKQSLLSVLKDMQRNNVGILCFSSNSRGWIYPLQPLDYATAANAINKVSAGGSTPLGGFIKDGADALLLARKKNPYGVYRLLVVTDGNATDGLFTPIDGNKGVLTGAGGVLEKGITISAIGVNMGKGHALATLIPYRSATDPEGLKSAIAAVFAETSPQAAAEDFEILSGLDSDVAVSIVKALSQLDNAPIGQRTVYETPSANLDGPPVAKEVVVAESHVVAWILGIFCLIILILILLAIFKS